MIGPQFFAGQNSPATANQLPDPEKSRPASIILSDIDLQVSDGVLEISGERKSAAPENAKVTVDERSFQKFSRRLQLSKDINSEGVCAELGNGLLTITIPKAASVMPRKVAVRKAGADAPAS